MIRSHTSDKYLGIIVPTYMEVEKGGCNLKLQLGEQWLMDTVSFTKRKPVGNAHISLNEKAVPLYSKRIVLSDYFWFPHIPEENKAVNRLELDMIKPEVQLIHYSEKK